MPLDLNTLKALKRCSLGLDLYLWLAYRTFALNRPVRITWRQVVLPVRSRPHQGERAPHRSRLPPQGAPRTKEDQDRLAGAALLDGQGRVDPLALAVNVTAATTPFTRGIALKPPFPRRKDSLRGSASIKWSLWGVS